MEKKHPAAPSFGQALRFWLKLGFVSFGGPAAQIAIMHRELVETKRWLDERTFLHGLNFSMLLPGPEAQQLATYAGWRLHGAKGGIAAGTLFVLPSAFLLFALSWLFVAGTNLPWIAALFHGLLGAVIAIVFEAVIRIGKKALRSFSLIALAALAFMGIYFFQVSYVFIVFAAALLGWLGHQRFPMQFPAGKPHESGSTTEALLTAVLPPSPKATWARTSTILIVTNLLWWAPVLALGLWLGWDSTPANQGFFFSKAAMVTFGGAYAVLPYVAQQAVETHHWLDHSQMMAGLALAETTPGPLIMVLQFVGFLGGWQHPGQLSPLTAALIGSAITTWVTFLPCFLFIFLGAPYIEKLGDFPKLSAALTAITACVVGVILNLAVKFSLAALWPSSSFDYFVAAIAILAFLALKTFKVPLIPLVITCALAGLAWHFVGFSV